MTANLPDTICPLPWLNLSLDVDGSSRPCCKFAHADQSTYQLANLSDARLEDVWNSDAMQRLRSDFRAGERPQECSACWDEEAAGIRSFRQTYLADRGITTQPDYDDPDPPQPAALDLKLSNACNLKCRICGPVASSAWLAEELAHLPEASATATFLRANKAYFQANKLTHDDANAATLRSWAPHIDHVEMTGGEPMLSRENREIIDLLVEHGRPERTTLLITTNATIVDERILAQIPKFGSVTLTLSIDDIGERLTYERSPAVWPDVAANIARYAAMSSPRCEVFTNCSVSTLNVWYLPEFLDWLVGTYPNGEILSHFNLVHNPRHACIQVLPEPLKDAVAGRLIDAADSDRWPERVVRPWNPSAMRPAEQVREVVAFMTSGDEPSDDAWRTGRAAVHQRDEIRGERFADSFPEYAAAIAQLTGEEPSARGGGQPNRTRRLIARLRG